MVAYAERKSSPKDLKSYAALYGECSASIYNASYLWKSLLFAQDYLNLYTLKPDVATEALFNWLMVNFSSSYVKICPQFYIERTSTGLALALGGGGPVRKHM